MAILKVKDQNGNTIEIPAIKGDAGKSAYEYAKEAGYDGTEAEFIALMVAVAAKAPAFTYGTEDLTAGTSHLATGSLHFVYE